MNPVILFLALFNVIVILALIVALNRAISERDDLDTKLAQAKHEIDQLTRWIAESSGRPAVEWPISVAKQYYSQLLLDIEQK